MDVGLAAGDSPRARRIAEQSIADLKLDLRGLVVYTEAASGPYVFTPLVAALAGADRVFAVTRTSSFATREHVEATTNALAQQWAVADRLDVRFEKLPHDVAASDVITNTGFVRPIDRATIGWMKSTAVIPLMWETWEIRDGELDLLACRECGIVVLGTREDRAPHSIYPYCGFSAMKLLFELGLEGYRTRVTLLGRGVLAASIHAVFAGIGLDVEWFGDGGAQARPYGEFRRCWLEAGASRDVLLLADHHTRVPLVGENGLVSCDELLTVNPVVRIGIISGQADFAALRRVGVRMFPEQPRPFGYMSYHSDALGPRGVLELYAAGLKVGEAMARARLAGCSPEETRRRALRESPAMDFVRS